MKILLLTAGFAFGAAATLYYNNRKPPLKPHLDFTPMKAKFRTPSSRGDINMVGAYKPHYGSVDGEKRIE